MTINEHFVSTVKAPRQGVVRVAGFMFLFAFIVPTLNWALGLSKLVVADDIAATADRIVANESLFRFGLTVELFMTAGLVVLGVTLYSLLKTVDRDIALLALALKMIEAALAATIVLLSLVAVLFATEASSSAAFTPEQLRWPVGLLLHEHMVLFACPMVFLGMDMILFFYLLYRSRYIPRPLAGLGILSFVLILIHALAHFVAPDFAGTQLAQVIFYTPSGITELVVGTWLLTRR